jgi:hypothetical protein
MERYTTWRRLNTYSVDSSMIRNVTDFIRIKLPAIVHFGEAPPAPPSSAGPTLPADGHGFYDALSLSIYGSDNSMIYKPVNKYTQSVFDNDVQALSIELAYKGEGKPEDSKAIVLVVRLGQAMEDSELSISLQDSRAKEKVMLIEDALVRTLEPNKNKNRIAYPNDFIPTLVFVMGFIIGLGGLMFENPLLNSLSAIIFGTAIYFVAHRFIKGYCSFESNRQKRLNIVLNWLTGALALFVISMIIRSVTKI